ncbi:hypothetical protein ID0603_10130 [Helicobacter pylori]
MEKLLSFLIIIKQKNYPPIDLVPWATPTIPMKTTVEIEEHRKNTTFDQNYHPFNYRQSSAGTKIISDALLSANYCFMDDENLKDIFFNKDSSYDINPNLKSYLKGSRYPKNFSYAFHLFLLVMIIICLFI